MVEIAAPTTPGTLKAELEGLYRSWRMLDVLNETIATMPPGWLRVLGIARNIMLRRPLPGVEVPDEVAGQALDVVNDDDVAGAGLPQEVEHLAHAVAFDYAAGDALVAEDAAELVAAAAGGAGEACAAGAADNRDECLASCELASCGDGFMQTGVELCDTKGASPSCDADCTPVMCGDSVVNPAAGESCEEGAVNTPNCDADCTEDYNHGTQVLSLIHI